MPQFGFSTTGEEAASALSSQIEGRTVLVTGVTPGTLGFETSRVIALNKPKLLIIAGRNPAKLNEVQKSLEEAAPGVAVRKLKVDLGSLDSVRAAAAEVNGWDDVPSVDVVINNAGIMAQPFSLTADGIESQFATNHMAHFLLTQLIMGKILTSKAPRVVNLSSNGYKSGPVRFDDYNFKNGEDYDRWKSYGQSKSANILYARGLTQRYKDRGLTAFSVHPGGIWTNLGLHAKDDLKAMGFMDENGNPVNSETMTWKTLGQGVSTTIVAAFDPSIADQSGAWLADCQIQDTPEEWTTDPEGPAKLWSLSEKLAGQKFD